MAAATRDIAKFEADYLTGRNPLAYIPLCQALRRDRRYGEALEHCQRGLQQGPDSVAGRTLLARLLCDLGRHDAALREVEKVERLVPPSKSLLVIKARAQGHLGHLKEAAVLLGDLEKDHLLDPEVQLLGQELRTLGSQRGTPVVVLPREAQSPRTPTRFVSIEALAAALSQNLAPLGLIHTTAVTDLDSGKSCIEGVQLFAESSDILFQELATACHDLDGGILSTAMIETQKALIIVTRRQRRLITVAIDPSMPNAGRFLLRTLQLLDQLCPGTRHSTPL
jgi:tetratricopeptide (TPR) repeat protein